MRELESYHSFDTAWYSRYTYDIRNRVTRAALPDFGTTGLMGSAASSRLTATSFPRS